jgi:hypothetical protein
MGSGLAGVDVIAECGEARTPVGNFVEVRFEAISP